MDAKALRTVRGNWGWTVLDAGGDQAAGYAAFEEVIQRYGEFWRHYHTFDHMVTVVGGVSAILEVHKNPNPAALFAAYLHDIIYDPRAKDNEARSAEFARELLQGLGVRATVREETARLILLTQTHQTTEDDEAGKALLDADLGVLRHDRILYDAYAEGIRKEYAWVPDAEYRAGRTRILEGFLNRPRIYQTPLWFQYGEQPARANLAREIAALRAA